MKKIKSQQKSNLSPGVEERYKEISDSVYHEGKTVSKFMTKYPSKNEIKFMQFLKDNGILFSFQKPFYKNLQGSRVLVEKYYIAQFWLHKKKLFIEIYSYRRNLPITTYCRSYDALDVFPKAQCIKLSDEDINNEKFMLELRNILN